MRRGRRLFASMVHVVPVLVMFALSTVISSLLSSPSYALSSCDGKRTEIVNGDFSYPGNIVFHEQIAHGESWWSYVKAQNGMQYDDSHRNGEHIANFNSNIFGWDSTQPAMKGFPANMVEMQQKKDDGQRYAEIVAESDQYAIYQDICARGGTTLVWQIDHAPRGGDYTGGDEIQVIIGEPGNERVQIATRKTNNGSGDKIGARMTTIKTSKSGNRIAPWETYVGNYSVPGSLNEYKIIRFTFRASNNGNTGRSGNLLDNVGFGVTIPTRWDIDVKTEVDKQSAGPGDSVTFTYYARQNGPDVLTNIANFSAVNTDGWQGVTNLDSWQAGRPAGGWTKVGTKTVKVGPTDVDKRLCSATRSSITSVNNNNKKTSEAVCVNISYGWSANLTSKSRLGKTADMKGDFTSDKKWALPGQYAEWLHEASQNGPTATSTKVNFTVGHKYRSGDYTEAQVAVWNSGQWPTNNSPYVDKVFRTIQKGSKGVNNKVYKITQDDVGNELCERLSASQSGYRNGKYLGPASSIAACVNAPYYYPGCTTDNKNCANVRHTDNCVMSNTCANGTDAKAEGLTPIVESDKSTVLPGGSVAFTYKVANNKGPTKSQDFNYRAYTFIMKGSADVSSNILNGPKVYNSWYDVQCWQRGLGSSIDAGRCRSGSNDKTFGLFHQIEVGAKETVATDKVNARNYWSVKPGDRICSYLAIDRWSVYGDENGQQYTPSVLSSPVKCAEVAKHPQIHVRGGDSYADDGFGGSDYGSEDVSTESNPSLLPEGTKVLQCKKSGEGATGPAATTFCWIDWGRNFDFKAYAKGDGGWVAFEMPGGYILARLTVVVNGLNIDRVVTKEQNNSYRKFMMDDYRLPGSIAFPSINYVRGDTGERGVRLIFNNVQAIASTGDNYLKNWEMAFTDSEVMSGGAPSNPGSTYEETIITSNKQIKRIGYIGNKDPRLSYNRANILTNNSSGGRLQLAGGGYDTQGRSTGDSQGAVVATSSQPSYYEINMMQHRHGGVSSVALGFNLPYSANDNALYNTSRGSFAQYGLLSNNGEIRNFGSAGYTMTTSSNRLLGCRLSYANTLNLSNCNADNLGNFNANTHEISVPRLNISDGSFIHKNDAELDLSLVGGNKEVAYYYYSDKPEGGTLTLKATRGVPAGLHVVIYVNGNVNIKSSIEYSGAVNARFNSLGDIPSVIVYATNVVGNSTDKKGSIYIDPSVANVDGIYIADNGVSGAINTCNDGESSSYAKGSGNPHLSARGDCSQKQLHIRGSIISRGSPVLYRTFGSGGTVVSGQLWNSDSTVAPSEIVELTPNSFLVQSKAHLNKDIKTYSTVSERTLPPRL